MPTIQRTEKCGRCRTPVGWFVMDDQEAVTAPYLKARRQWLHLDDQVPYLLCRVNGLHPAPGVSSATAVPRSKWLERRIVLACVVLGIAALAALLAWQGSQLPDTFQ